ncbi:hypothetical protein Gasu2_17490 [Galdieria sulphuraria]|uniref:Uncharacterized protein n=1 Tax=Galdieria sulphuraria TaxID=130081 RepID=M2VTP5_GALSU|nr:uncharacterized protein Gasu_58140 [Galdieria sulphuraria]EME26581.1 hypothetical protein Gasu_58140 [Galdieria sulphuraria]GJD07386.1 hypothetical protein Gasu2_17490 [Galdieria sulphuraria]|eukprot:XP_005703101.1 hypothetical protein Gasu_58140 [Galdieria sulphuraria]
MEYLGPNRRGRPGKSYGVKSRRSASVSNRPPRKESFLWDNSKRFIEDESGKDAEFFSLDLETSSSPLLKRTVLEDDIVDDENFSFIEKFEFSIRDLSPGEISRKVLYSTASDSQSFSQKVHFLDVEFDSAKDSNSVKKIEVETADEKKQSDIELLSSASNEAFDDWFDKLNLK